MSGNFYEYIEYKGRRLEAVSLWGGIALINPDASSDSKLIGLVGSEISRDEIIQAFQRYVDREK
jgi:hypothetical protein